MKIFQNHKLGEIKTCVKYSNVKSRVPFRNQNKSQEYVKNIRLKEN